MKLVFDDLKVKGKVIVSKGILNLEDTGVYLIHGDNGTGKTLLLNNIHANAKGLTVLVPQDSTDIVPNLTVEENLAMEILDSFDERIRELLNKYRLSYLLDLKPGKMSGGENRIISLLRGIFSSAPVVLLDEPTNDLDFSMVEKLVAIISDFALHKCFLIVTHDDRLGSLAKGSVTICKNRVNDDGPAIVSDSLDKSFSKLEQLEDKSLDTELIGFIWKRGINAVGIVVLIIMCIISAYKLSVREVIGDVQETYLPGNQVHILRCHARHATSGPQGYGMLPITVMDEILSGNLWFSARKIDEVMNNTLHLDQGLPQLSSSEKFTVYPIEYFADRHYISVLNDLYLSNFVDVTTELAWVDTTGYFYSEPGLGKKVTFDPKLYAESVAAAERLITDEGNSYKPIHHTIILADGFSVIDLIEELPQEFFSVTTYIQTRETIAAGVEIATILQDQDLIRVIAELCGLLLSIEAAYLLLFCAVKSRGLRLLVNYGYDFQVVRDTILRYSNDKLIRSLLCFALAGFIFFHLGVSNTSKYVFAKYALVLIVAASAFFGYKLKLLAINLMVKLVYSWKYR